MVNFPKLRPQLIIVIAVLLLIRYSMIRFFVEPLKATKTDKAQGLYPLLETGINVLIGSMIVLFTLTQFGISLAPVLSGAFALFYVFGKIIEDVVGGFVILVQDRFDLGDIIQIDDQFGMKGRVVQLGYRGTTIEDANGKQWTIRNSDLYNRIGLIQKASLDENVVFTQLTLSDVANPRFQQRVQNTTQENNTNQTEAAAVIDTNNTSAQSDAQAPE